MHERALNELKTQGYTMLHGLVTEERLGGLRGAPGKGDRQEAPVPRQTAEPGCLRGYNLVRRDALFREALQQPEVVALAEALLGSDCILHSFEARSALPGGGQQSLHRDMPFVEKIALSVNVVW